MIRTRGLVLIEVVAALALLASTATLLLVAHGRSLTQLHSTNQQETAARLAEELLTAWKLENADTTLAGEGSFAQSAGWRWTRTVKPYEGAPNSDVVEITLTVLHTKGTQERVLATYTWLEHRRAPKNV